MYLADYHVHSSCSPDGHVTMADMARTGIERGLSEICFTDHVEPIVWGTSTPRTGEYDWAALRAQYDEAVRGVLVPQTIGSAILRKERRKC